jgi:hypothetical protein
MTRKLKSFAVEREKSKKKGGLRNFVVKKGENREKNGVGVEK